jgi:hypothetical protein
MATTTPRPIPKLACPDQSDPCALNWPALSRALRLSPQQSTIVQLIVTEDLTTEAIGLPPDIWASRHRLSGGPHPTRPPSC